MHCPIYVLGSEKGYKPTAADCWDALAERAEADGYDYFADYEEWGNSTEEAMKAAMPMLDRAGFIIDGFSVRVDRALWKARLDAMVEEALADDRYAGWSKWTKIQSLRYRDPYGFPVIFIDEGYHEWYRDLLDFMEFPRDGRTLHLLTVLDSHS